MRMYVYIYANKNHLMKIMYTSNMLSIKTHGSTHVAKMKHEWSGQVNAYVLAGLIPVSNNTNYAQNLPKHSNTTYSP